MQKKIYVAPNFEVYNMEPESMLANSFENTLDPENTEEENDVNNMSNKRQPNAPWSKSPWE